MWGRRGGGIGQRRTPGLRTLTTRFKRRPSAIDHDKEQADGDGDALVNGGDQEGKTALFGRETGPMQV